ncbi:MAG: GNAT family N-acetyltransferase [Taibaiella sp.]|nr:GNAT family N-acetyltransferase [Taibaiella sp.]
MNIIRINKDAVRPAANIFTQAFKQEPIFKYIFGNEKKYSQAAPWLFASWVKWAVRFGEAWMSDDGNAAVIMRRMENSEMSFSSMVKAGMLPTPLKLGLPAFRRFYFTVLPILEKKHKEIMGNTPHWYGWMIGSTTQGKGMGRPLLEHVKAIADDKGLPIFLETATESNLALYHKLGFEVKDQQIVNGECTIYFLVRQPVSK